MLCFLIDHGFGIIPSSRCCVAMLSFWQLLDVLFFHFSWRKLMVIADGEVCECGVSGVLLLVFTCPGAGLIRGKLCQKYSG